MSERTSPAAPPNGLYKTQSNPGVQHGTATPLRAGGFRLVPFADETTLSTRGQHLPAIISSRASAQNLPELTRSTTSSPRRISYFRRDLSPVEPDLEAGGGRRTPRLWERRRSKDDRGDSRGQDQPMASPLPPDNFPLTRDLKDEYRRRDSIPVITMTPQMRSQRLIGNSNPRYRWAQYYKSDEELKEMKQPLRKYYERNNYLIQQYMYIDRLLDSSLPHSLLQEYQTGDDPKIPPTIDEEPDAGEISPKQRNGKSALSQVENISGSPPTKSKRNAKDLYKLPDEETPLLLDGQTEEDHEPTYDVPMFQPEEDIDSDSPIVTVAIYVNLAANTALLAMKIVVTVLTSSLSVLASLVDAALDFLSTAIVWVTTHLISTGNDDTMNYPVGRRRLEPIGVLVFSVIMITSFFQVFIEAIQRLASSDRSVVKLSNSAIGIMAATVGIKGLCWLWCRFIKNSSVQALAQDAATDVVFNTFSIIFPLVGYFFDLWYLDPLGGMILSLYVIFSWSRTTATHIANLTGRVASKDERNILLYLTMRFAKTIKQIQSLSAYHTGDRINVEVDIVLDEDMNLRDSHDLGESLQHVLESVPGVERAYIHTDYASINLPTHMRQ